MKTHAEHLLNHLLNGGNDSTANELLAEFFDGYPIEKLRLLLESKQETAFKAGAWIASELGERVGPLVDELSRSLEHSSRYVRFFILDAILSGATNEHGEAISRAVLRIQDPDEAIRWKALRFLAKATQDQLAAAMPHLGDDSIGKMLVWLIDSLGTEIRKQDVIGKLSDTDRLVRMFAAAVSARLAPFDITLLEHAAVSTDTEVSSFAKEELDALRSH